MLAVGDRVGVGQHEGYVVRSVEATVRSKHGEHSKTGQLGVIVRFDNGGSGYYTTLIARRGDCFPGPAIYRVES